MTDIGSIAVVLNSIKTATEIARLIKDSDLSLEKAELKLRLAELISSLADAKIEMVALQDEMHQRDTRIKELEAELSGASELTYKQPFYWKFTSGAQEGPFCQRCYDIDKKSVRLQRSMNVDSWICKACDKSYRE